MRFGNVTTNFFHMMGAKVVLGRDFTDADGLPQPTPPPGATPGTPIARLPVMVILSHHIWQRRFGGRTDIIGKPLQNIGPANTTIVGVLAPGFELLFPRRRQRGTRARYLVRQPHPV